MQQLIRTCGGENLRGFESQYLMSRLTNKKKRKGDDESSPTSEQASITCRDFTKAVESYMNDANTDSYALVLYLFKKKFGEAVSPQTCITRADLMAFLGEFGAYF